jgi:phosphoribosylformimino-5-aminoimidazole carboxamide ribotide isomerase
MRLIPSIDLRGGRCVRLLRGDFAAETRYDLEPHELLARYRGLGADWLHVVDLDGARDGKLANRAAILTLATQRGVNLQVGGGLRSVEVVDDLLRNGVDRAVVGSAAVEQPEEVAAWLGRFGPERICLAFDVRLDAGGNPLVQTRGWTQATAVSLWQAVDRYAAAGLRHVLCTDVERDGAMAGPSIALYADCVGRYPQIAWQASGGVRDGADLDALAAIGVAAAISGKALLEERIAAADLARFLGAPTGP